MYDERINGLKRLASPLFGMITAKNKEYTHSQCRSRVYCYV